MPWTKHLAVVKSKAQLPQPDRSQQGYSSMTARTSSWLNIAYQGNPQRIPRYYQFQEMDNDSDINTALDTIADFCTQSEEQSDEPFEVKFHNDPNEAETKIIKQMLDRWIKLNNFRSRLWYMFRDTIKNGDAFFLRDPETFEWLWLDHFMVEMVKVDETKGKVPDEYIVRGLDYNRQGKFATKQADPNAYRTPFGTSTVGGARPVSGGMSAPTQFTMAGNDADGRRAQQGPNAQELSVIDAQYVVHLSLSIGNDINWPFGPSILEPVFKTFKQKELLEDAIIIYRVQRAPERRIFYIDVGNMPPERAKRHIEAIKNEIHQRRIPNRSATGGSVLDAAYNPLCLSFDTRIPLLDGRTLSLAEIIEEYQAGKKNWVYSCDPITGEIMPGDITWAGPTRKDAEVIKVTLDNGESLICTPDHKIPVLGKGFVEAQHLTPDDSLVAFHTRQKNVDRKRENDRTYTQVYDHSTKKWAFVHRMVGEFFRARRLHQEVIFSDEYADHVKQTIHHIDYDRYNNDPSNLAYMAKLDHIAFHVAERQSYWDNMPASERERVTRKISESLKLYYSGWTEERRAEFSQFSSRRNKLWIAEKRERDPEGFAKWRADVGRGRSKYLQDHPDEAATLSARLRTVCKTIKNQSFVSTQKMLAIIAHTVVAHGSNRLDTAALLQNNEELLAEIRRANPEPDKSTKSNINRMAVTPPRIDKIVADFGFKNWKDFAKKASLYNHRILSIEPAGKMDVGTITVDGSEQYHPHHTFATASGIFVKNSINDDYFFACLQLDTQLLIADGRSLRLRDLIAEFQSGADISVQAPGGEIGKVAWAGVTRKDAELVRVTLDNGTHVDATPDHRFIADDGKELYAGEMATGQRLLSVNQDAPVSVSTVEVLPYREDTGDISIETASGSHIFALTAGVYVHNSSPEGRGSKVETLPGGESTGEVSDLLLFSKKLARGLRVPTSYLNLGEESSGVAFNDGKLGAAMIQEYRFSKFCMRLQSLLAPRFDEEFKRYLQKNGIEIEQGLFELRFNPPQSFTRYRQIELDTQRIAVYQGVAENKKLSERFKLRRFLGLSEDEIIENEEMWSEENADKLKRKTGASPAESGGGEGLGAVGIHPGDDMGMPPMDMPEGDESAPGDDAGAGGGAPGAGGGGAPGPAGNASPVPAPAGGGGGPG